MRNIKNKLHQLENITIPAMGAALSLMVAMSVEAATFSLSFSGDSWDGNGSLSFDNSSITGVGEETILLNDLINPDFSFNVFRAGAPILNASNLAGVSFRFWHGTLIGFTHDLYFHESSLQQSWGDWYSQGGIQFIDLSVDRNYQFIYGNNSNYFRADDFDVAYSEQYYWNGSQAQLVDPDGDGVGERNYTRQERQYTTALYDFEVVEPIPEPFTIIGGLGGLGILGLSRLRKRIKTH
jgi:hypothetical protein